MGSGGRREGHPGTKHHPIVRGGAAKNFLRTLAHSPPPRSARVVALAVARAADTDRVRSAPRGRCCRSFVCGSPAASYFGRGTEGRVSLIPRPPGVHLPRRTHARCPARRASRARSHLRAATVPLRASKFSSSFFVWFFEALFSLGVFPSAFSPVSGPLRRVAWQGMMAHGDRDGEWCCARSGGGGKYYGGCRERQHAKAKGVSRSYSEPCPATATGQHRKRGHSRTDRARHPSQKLSEGLGLLAAFWGVWPLGWRQRLRRSSAAR